MTHTSIILIVDDEPSARDTLEALLFKEGYNLAFASNGIEAMAKAAELVPDLILLDVMMPGMDGFEVCQRLRSDSLLADVPIVMVTALDDVESRIHGIEAGADDFISKPCDGFELRARVRAITKLNRYRRLLMERAKFEWVVEQTRDGYLIVSDGDEVLYANPQARQYLNLPLPLSKQPLPIQLAPREASTDVKQDTPILGTFLELIEKQYRCEPRESWATWLEGTSKTLAPSPTPRYLVRPESSMFGSLWLQVDVMEMPSQSNLIRLRDVTADITTQSNVWTFHKLIAHKLRTPLGPLIGFLDMLLDDVSTLSESKVDTEYLLSSAREGAVRLQNEILAILDYIKAVNVPSPHADRCSLAEISALITEITSDLQLESVHTTWHDLQDLDVTLVQIASPAIDLILRELCENAKKFHPEKSPTLEIEISRIQEGIQIQVCDDGVTLSPEQLTEMWIPYYQVDRYFSGEIPGMGLGLATVASKVWSVGGTCRSYNRGNSPGIMVEIILPLAREDAQDQWQDQWADWKSTQSRLKS